MSIGANTPLIQIVLQVGDRHHSDISELYRNWYYKQDQSGTKGKH